MALATRCPYCRTTFRVTHDQLKLRGGLVRCGACKEIFSGVEHLLPAQDSAPVAPAPDAPPSSAASVSPRIDADGVLPQEAPASGKDAQLETPASQQATPDHDTQPDPKVQAGKHPDAHTPADVSPQADTALPTTPSADTSLPPTTPQQDIDPLTRMTLMDMRPWPQAHTHAPRAGASAEDTGPTASTNPETDEIERALGELQQKPWRGATGGAMEDGVDEIDALDNEEPEFVRQARLQEERRRKSHLVFGLGSLLLLVLALLQGTIVMRTEIAARWPASLPAINQLCALAGCKTGLPQHIEQVTIESHELQAVPDSDSAFVLSTLLRNRSKTVQAWPHLELTLNDAAQQPVARRVLAPADYLTAQERARGMPPSSEKSVRVSFTLYQLKASGYQLYVFYP